jgi:aromatic ring-opening dioxygenase LigB subunit
MPLAFACIAPHGHLIPALSSPADLQRFRLTRQAMRRLGRDIEAARPHTIVVATPHNLRLIGKIGVVTAANSSGALVSGTHGFALTRLARGRRRVQLHVTCDVRFAKTVLATAEARGLPVVGANYGTAEGSVSDMPMDWGTLVPLWFFLKETRLAARVVVVTPSREIPLRQNVRFGEVIADVAEQDHRRIVFVASADHAHAHKKSGPYGFSAAAAEYDARMVKAIEANDLTAVLRLRPRLVDRAKPDSLWQVAVLAGITSRLGLRGELYSYEVPAYYGMICAAYR